MFFNNSIYVKKYKVTHLQGFTGNISTVQRYPCHSQYTLLNDSELEKDR